MALVLNDGRPFLPYAGLRADVQGTRLGAGRAVLHAPRGHHRRTDAFGLPVRYPSAEDDRWAVGDLRRIYRRFATIEQVRVIRCDCGFEATGDGDDELVSRAQAHAREVHDVELSAELVLGLAGTRVQPQRD